MKPKKPTYSDVLATGKAVETLQACLDAIEEAQYACPLQRDLSLTVDGTTLGDALQGVYERICEYYHLIEARNRKVELAYFMHERK